MHFSDHVRIIGVMCETDTLWIPMNRCIVCVVCVRQIQANVRVLTQERDNVNALYSEVDINKLIFICFELDHRGPEINYISYCKLNYRQTNI